MTRTAYRLIIIAIAIVVFATLAFGQNNCPPGYNPVIPKQCFRDVVRLNARMVQACDGCADTAQLTTQSGNTRLKRGDYYLNISNGQAALASSVAGNYIVNASSAGILLQQHMGNTITITYSGDTAHVHGDFSAWDFVPPLPTGGSSGWALTGNAGTIPGTNFIGTTDNQDLMFKIANVRAAYLDTGSLNMVAFGLRALLNNTGANNTAIGQYAMLNNTTGSLNTAIGFSALLTNTTGIRNVSIGQISLGVIAGGDRNTAVGFNALHQLTSGGSNTALGNKAGAAVTNCNNCTFLGDSARATASGLTNATAIGSAARVDTSNAIVLGSSATNTGIGTNKPDAKLHVVGTFRFVDGNQAEAKILTSDANGYATWQNQGSARTVSANNDTAQKADNNGTVLINNGASNWSFYLPAPSSVHSGYAITVARINSLATGIIAVTTVSGVVQDLAGTFSGTFALPAFGVLGRSMTWVSDGTAIWYLKAGNY